MQVVVVSPGIPCWGRVDAAGLLVGPVLVVPT